MNIQIKTLHGDEHTPVSLYTRLKGGKKFLLESSLRHMDKGRFSFIGRNPKRELIGRGGETEIADASGRTTIQSPGLGILQHHLPMKSCELPFPFYGGAVGYAGYDAIRQYECIGNELPDEIGMPDLHFMYCEDIVVYDHRTEKIHLIAADWEGEESDDRLLERLEQMATEIMSKAPQPELKPESVQFQPQISRDEFVLRVEKAKELIRRGEIFQVVLSQRMEGRIKHDPFSFYRQLRLSNPSPYMFFIDFGEYVLLGASPESLVRVQGREVTANPIAGTRARGKTGAEDSELEKNLVMDEKEAAEHRMLVDLSRNDLGRLCVPGSIRLSRYMEVERYRHVMHLVSEVKGRLEPEFTSTDALISSLPAGTVSGAPKIRAMQIINELEGKKRGAYAGAVGYMNVNGDADFALAIRSLAVKGQRAYVQAGAGIVYDSDPGLEYEETLNKAKALLEVGTHDSYIG